MTLVVNYNMPKSIQEYTHRIGRTGRAGLTGNAASFFTDYDTHILYDLKQQLIKCKQIVPHELEKHPDAQFKPGDPCGRRKGPEIQYADDGKGKGQSHSIADLLLVLFEHLCLCTHLCSSS